jgi:spore coat-associated protein N
MNFSKKKIALLAGTSTLTIGLLVGGATYALFTGSASNVGNTFKAGNVHISEHRHDIPIEGPMFYTNDTVDGRMGTGLWQPKDSHTRGMFYENDGNVDAMLGSIKAEYTGDDAKNFAKQSIVTLISFKTKNGKALDATAIDNANQIVDGWFKTYKSWGWDLSAKGLQTITADLREYFLDKEILVNDKANEPIIAVPEDIYVDSLENLATTGATEPFLNKKNFVVPVGESRYLAYNVTLTDNQENNLVKNKEVKFNFVSTFEQLKNNPNKK